MIYEILIFAALIYPGIQDIKSRQVSSYNSWLILIIALVYIFWNSLIIKALSIAMFLFLFSKLLEKIIGWGEADTEHLTLFGLYAAHNFLPMMLILSLIICCYTIVLQILKRKEAPFVIVFPLTMGVYLSYLIFI